LIILANKKRNRKGRDVFAKERKAFAQLCEFLALLAVREFKFEVQPLQNRERTGVPARAARVVWW
jgi:hypothetical protein